MSALLPLPYRYLLTLITLCLALGVPQSGWGQPTAGLLDSSARAKLLSSRQEVVRTADADALTRIHAALAGDAFTRAALLTRYWLDRRDPGTGLFPTSLKPGGRVWTYEDAASDLFPFLAIGASLLIPSRYGELLDTLSQERRRSPGLPRDIALSAEPLEAQDDEEVFLGATEYSKDGLLPMVEMLGREPWLGRLEDVTRSVLLASHTPTPDGPIVGSSTEINGNALQVLARLYWATRDPQYLEMGRRITVAYLEVQLPDTQDLPAHRWDFIENEPIGPRRFFLGDHGNEVVSGLVEWHRVELEVDPARAALHRKGIRELMDRLLTKGRTADGLWYELIDVPTGRVRDDDLTDNWGYLAQAYLNQADIERTYPGGDPSAAERYEQAARRALAAVARTGAYEWDEGTMDGYADTIESALYVLRSLPDAEATEWLHQEMGRLLEFQKPDGRVTDENIDGNFIRTSLLYALWLSQGVRLDPWQPGLQIGATRVEQCLQVHIAADAAWNGRLIFDTPRHKVHLGLPTDYPRLNQWMEWFTVAPEQTYAVSGLEGSGPSTGATLAGGIPLQLTPGQSRDIRTCPSGL